MCIAQSQAEAAVNEECVDWAGFFPLGSAARVGCPELVFHLIDPYEQKAVDQGIRFVLLSVESLVQTHESFRTRTRYHMHCKRFADMRRSQTA